MTPPRNTLCITIPRFLSFKTHFQNERKKIQKRLKRLCIRKSLCVPIKRRDFIVSSSLLSLLSIVFLIIPIAIIYFAIKYMKRMEKRSEEKLLVEKQSTITLQKRVDELNERLVIIEKMLKEVE